jgi:hypothetical protein
VTVNMQRRTALRNLFRTSLAWIAGRRVVESSSLAGSVAAAGQAPALRRITAEDLSLGFGPAGGRTPRGGSDSKIGLQTFVVTCYSVKDFPSIQAAVDRARLDGAAVLFPPDAGAYTANLTNTDGVPLIGLGAPLTLTVDGQPVRCARVPLAVTQRYSERVDPSVNRQRPAAYMYVVARDGGTYGTASGNSSHGHFFLKGVSATPTELVSINYEDTNYAFGDAGLAAGTTTIYGAGLCRGIEHNSVQGDRQFEATLTAISGGGTSLSYARPSNADTLGAGRELIDLSLQSTGNVVSFSGSTVVGLGTRWDRSLVGQFLKMTTDDRTLGGKTASAWYRITAVDDETHLTIESSYGGDACPPFGGAATSPAYVICPGAMLSAFDAGTGTLTVEANTVGWAPGHRVQLRIHPLPQLACYVAVVRRTLPSTQVTGDAAFIAHTIGERAGSGFATLGNFFYGIGLFGRHWTGLAMAKATIDSEHAIELPGGKRITWFGPNNDGGPGIRANGSTGAIEFLQANRVVGSIFQDGAASFQNLNSGVYTPTLTNQLNVSSSSASPLQWMRVGNTVTVSGQVDIATVAGDGRLTQISVSLPVSSNFTAATQGSGTLASDVEAGRCQVDVANKRGLLSFASRGTTARGFSFSFTYQVL